MNDEELRERWFNKVTDRFIWDGKMESEDWARLTPLQKAAVRWVLRANARLKAKYDRQGADGEAG